MAIGLDNIARRIEEHLATGAPHGIKGLTDEHIRKGCDPHGIAKLWLHDMLHPQKNQHIELAESGSYALLPFSQVVFESIQSDGAEAWTFPITLRLKASSVDKTRLHDAVEAALHNHPAFAMRIDDSGMQHYDQAFRTPYLTYEITADGQYAILKMTFNRILGDATSLMLLLSDIDKAYQNEPLEHDGYLEYLAKAKEHSASAEHISHKKELHERFDNICCPTYPQPDNEAAPADSTMAVLYDDYSTDQERIAQFCKQHKVSLNILFSHATALALMDYNRSDEAALTWAYIGRETADEQHIFGSLHRDVPLHVRRSADLQALQALEQTRCNMEKGIMLSDYPYTFHAANRQMWKNAVNVLVQPNITDMLEQCRLPFEYVQEENAKPQPAYCMLDIEVTDNPLFIALKYSSAHYEEKSIQRFAAMIHRAIETIVGVFTV